MKRVRNVKPIRLFFIRYIEAYAAQKLFCLNYFVLTERALLHSPYQLVLPTFLPQRIRT